MKILLLTSLLILSTSANELNDKKKELQELEKKVKVLKAEIAELENNNQKPVKLGARLHLNDTLEKIHELGKDYFTAQTSVQKKVALEALNIKIRPLLTGKSLMLKLKINNVTVKDPGFATVDVKWDMDLGYFKRKDRKVSLFPNGRYEIKISLEDAQKIQKGMTAVVIGNLEYNQPAGKIPNRNLHVALLGMPGHIHHSRLSFTNFKMKIGSKVFDCR